MFKMIRYKINVLKELKSKGYNQTILRKKNILPQQTIQNLRDNKYISLSTLDRICELLNCGISDIIEYVPDRDNDDNK
jgi:DNA-binding Xre family transcriptional regulator